MIARKRKGTSAEYTVTYTKGGVALRLIRLHCGCVVPVSAFALPVAVLRWCLANVRRCLRIGDNSRVLWGLGFGVCAVPDPA